MNLISWEFAAFVAAALAIYYLLPGRFQNAWLVIASYAFYATLGWQFALVLVAVTLANYLIAQRIEANRSWLWGGIILNVLTLLFFKGVGLWQPALASLTGGPPDALAILLPIGLSFTILQCISYLLDVSRGQLGASRSLIDFSLMLAYFPKLTSGPIEKPRSFLPQLQAPRALTNEMVAKATALIVIGLLRKVVIAEILGRVLPDRLFLDPTQGGENGLSLTIRLLAYAFALFNDFAGYSSLVRGISLLFGIELTPNFLTPYFSRNFTEFWNQWHISLSQWLRETIYFPLSRALLRINANPRWIPNVLIPPIITMAISGLWHELNERLLLWGLIHGAYLVIERIIALLRPGHPPDKEPVVWQVVSAITVFVAAVPLWLLFRTSTTAIEAYFRVIFDATRPVTFAPLAALIFIALSVVVDAIQAKAKDELVFLRWPLAARSAALAAAVLLIAMSLTQGEVQVFFYQRF